MSELVKRLQTSEATFDRTEVERLRVALGICDTVPEPSLGVGDGERWTRESIIKWGKNAVRCRPLSTLVHR